MKSDQYTIRNANQSSILLVDDEPTIHTLFSRLLKHEGYDLDTTDTGETAIKMLERKEYKLLIVDKNLPGISGMDVIIRANSLQPDLEIILITGYASYESAIEALRLGVFDYMEKPFADVVIIVEKVRRALEKQRLTYENRVLSSHLRSIGNDLQELKNKKKQSLSDIKKAGGDVKKISQYLDDAVEQITWKMRQEQLSVGETIKNIGYVTSELDLAISDLDEAMDNPPAVFSEIKKLVQQLIHLTLISKEQPSNPFTRPSKW